MCDFSLHNVKSRPAKVGDKATLFINHDKKQTDKLKLLPAVYD